MARRRNARGRFVKGAQRSSRRRRHVRHSNPPRRKRSYSRRRRKNPLTVSYHRRKRHYRRNPPKMLGGLLGGMPPLKRIMAGAVGAGAARIVPGLVSRFVPQIPTVGALGIAVKALASMLMGNVAGKFLGKQFGEDFTFGAFVVLADEAARAYLYPAVGVNAYLDDTGMNAYLGSYLTPGQTVPSLGDGGGFTDVNDYGPLSGMVDDGGRLDAGNRF